MMRCSNCDRDYPSDLRFCHQCGEALHALPRPDESPEALGEPIAPRQRVLAAVPRRRRPPSRSSSPLFALLVLLAAGVGLALVWYQWWMPTLVRVSAKLPEAEAPRPVDQLTPRPAREPEPTTPPAAPVPEPVSPPTSTGIVTTPAPPTALAPAAIPDPAPAAEPVPRKAAPRPAPAPVEPVRPPVVAKQTEPAPPTSSARPEPAVPSTASGARAEPAAPSKSSGASARPELAPTPAPSAPVTRVITLVPVGGGAGGARAHLYWEFSQGGRLMVSGLPPPPPGRTYQLWLGSIKLGNRASGGLLVVDSQGEGTLRITAPRASWSPDIFGVTVERQGGAREPSDELVLVGELTRQTPVAAREPSAPPGGSTPRGSSTVPVIASAQGGAAPLVSSDARPLSAPPQAAGSAAPPAPVPGSQPAAAVTAALPPPAPVGPPSALVRIVPVPMERAWTVSQSVLRSLGWDIERTDRAEGLIRTEPRNVDFKNVGVYATGTRHALDLSVRAVSETHTSISVKRELFEEQRIFWSRERTTLPLRDTAVEQAVLDAIEHLL
jgi:hypothetical protein